MVEKVVSIGQAAYHRGERRRAIHDAATLLFAERGFEGVSLQDIAEAAGTVKATVLYHFASKEALHEAVIGEALGRVAEVMREFLAGEFSRERVAYLLDQIQAFFADHRAHARLLMRELLEPGAASAYFKRFVEPIYVPAVAGLEAAMRNGQVRRIDPAMFIHDLHVQLIGYFCHGPLLERLMEGDPYTVERLIARREYLLEQIYRQLAPGTSIEGGAT